MLSASHNPVADNGIKVFGGDGYKLSDAEEERVEQLLQRTDEDRPTGTAIGRVRPEHGLTQRYVAHLAGAVARQPRALGRGPLHGLRVVVDCANGAASAVAPDVLLRLGCEVTALFADPTGDDINAGCGSTHPDVGLAHDGDADRLVAVDAEGALVDGDQILAVLARRLHQEQGLATVVTTVMTNLGFHQAMQGLGIDVVQTRVGDRYVLEAMREGGHPLGGEQSGHVIAAEYVTTGDGILTAVLLLDAMAASGRPLAELAAVMTRLPQVLVNVAGVERKRLDEAEVVWKAVAEEEAALGDSGRVLVRPSGTEPLIRVMVEAPTAGVAQEAAGRIAAVVDAELGMA
jgi:phosphoglucosamine mutase